MSVIKIDIAISFHLLGISGLEGLDSGALGLAHVPLFLHVLGCTYTPEQVLALSSASDFSLFNSLNS